MRRKLGISLVLAVIAAGADGTRSAAGDGAWVSESGQRHPVQAKHVAFVPEGGTKFDLSELADGERRVFGSGDKELVATRAGEVVTLTRTGHADGDMSEVECLLGKDTCHIVTFGDTDKIAVVIEKTRRCVNGVGDCDGVEVVVGHAGGPGEHLLFFGGSGALEDGATDHDLGELDDGESRTFGFGEKQLTAVRSGDVVRLSRPAIGEQHAIDMSCNVDTDDCRVLTFDDDPDKAAIVIAKSSTCAHGQGDCTIKVISGQPHAGGAGFSHEIEKVVVVEQGDGGAAGKVRRIQVITEDED